MSRIAKNPILVSKDVECNFNQGIFSVKGKLGKTEVNINPNYTIKINENEIMVFPLNKKLSLTKSSLSGWSKLSNDKFSLNLFNLLPPKFI